MMVQVFLKILLKALGEPYIKSKIKNYKNNAGLGLGTFLGKTLLRKTISYYIF